MKKDRGKAKVNGPIKGARASVVIVDDVTGPKGQPVPTFRTVQPGEKVDGPVHTVETIRIDATTTPVQMFRPCKDCQCENFDYEVGEHPGVCNCRHGDSRHEMKGMTREQLDTERSQDAAFARAVKVFGDRAVVGRNYNYANDYHVGQKGPMGIWVKRGVGKSWDEAFANVKDYPDGKMPKTHA